MTLNKVLAPFALAAVVLLAWSWPARSAVPRRRAAGDRQRRPAMNPVLAVVTWPARWCGRAGSWLLRTQLDDVVCRFANQTNQEDR